ncbi:hypothetical protein X766_32415 [Mesorhizobium sp. LSJC255A00]|nr:hypothetical protein X766_32415 [Mesorhizobium sp. LSJC255A00]
MLLLHDRPSLEHRRTDARPLESAAVAHFLRIAGDRRLGDLTESGLTLDEFGREVAEDAQQSTTTRICPSQAAEAPIPMVGIATFAVIRRASASGGPLQHHRECSGLGHRTGIAPDGSPSSPLPWTR